MFHDTLLTPQLFSIILQEEKGGFPWWLVLLLLAIVIIILIWALTRNAGASEPPPAGHAHEVPAHGAPAPEAPAQVEPPAVPVKAEPVVVLEAPPPAAEPIPAVEPIAAAAPAPAIPDDLEIIEGIGPKIAGVFKEAGISTFAQLAATPVERLEEILKAANLRLGDPATWPEQARLAAAGDLEGLKKLQDSLKGGRVV